MAFLTAIFVFLNSPSEAGVATGWQLDPGFSGDGVAVTTFSDSPDVSTWATDTVIQPDGKLVAVGAYADETASISDIAVARYLNDGSLDPEFGDGGIARISATSEDHPFSVTTEEIGGQVKLLIGGSAFDPATAEFVVELVRLNADGSLDTDHDADPAVHLGTDGWQLVSFGRDIGGRGALVLPDGGILAYGDVRDPGSEGPDVGVARLVPETGALDTTFGRSGRRVMRLPGYQEVTDAIAQPTATGYRILLGGMVAAQRRADPAVFAFTSNGAIDSGFGFGGAAVISLRANAQVRSSVGANSIAVDAQRRVLLASAAAAGTTTRTDYAPAVVRLRPGGRRLDTAFGTGGVAVIGRTASTRDRIANDAVVRPDGSVVWCGVHRTPAGGETVRTSVGGLLANGAPDPSYGATGFQLLDIGPGADQCSAVTLDAGGRPVVSDMPAVRDLAATNSAFRVFRLAQF